jgi:hypothetical protein
MNTTAAPSPSEVVPPTRRQRIVVGGMATLVGLFVYALSAGPMIWINERVKVSQFEDVLKIVYAPLAFVVKHELQPFAAVLKWYISLFR